MAASVSINHPGSYNGGGIHNPGIQSGIAFEIEISECVAASSPIPKRVRQRLEESSTESKFKSPASLEEIEFKLKEADSRRQQFHEWLANKARAKPRSSPSHSEQAENLAQRLEAKLSAAEQKRAEILAQEQTRLAKLHEVRVAAKTEAQLRAEREREELGSKVEFRVQQAEINRLGLVEAEKQRIAAVHERIAQSILQRTTQEGRDRARIEALRATICQKIAAAEEKRAGLLEAEKNRAQACVLQARRVAKAVVRERELEMRKKKEKLEARLQRAKRQRAEYLMKRGGCRGSCHNHGHKLHKHGDRLCRKLTRCWRQFRGSRSTTHALAQEYAACAINQELVMSLPFEQLASRITSPATLRGVKPLLARIESRLMLSSAGKSNIGQVEHLLKRLSPPRRRAGAPSVVGKQTSMGVSKGAGKDNAGRSQNAAAISKASSKETPKVADDRELERYPARVFLCAYMILGQPDAVFSGRGGREVALAEAAAKLLPEFEALLSIILYGPPSIMLPPSSPTVEGSTDKSGFDSSAAGEQQQQQKDQNNFRLPSPQRPFSAQLAAFDAAWCSYLYHFVAWKVKDAQLLEEDLTRMACQLEISMLQKCKGGNDLSHDSQAIRTQVREDQKLLHDRILRLTGAAGALRMEQALSEVRSKFNEAVENGSPLPSPFASPGVPSRTPIASPTSPSPFIAPSERVLGPKVSSDGNRPNVVRSLFNSPDKNDTLPAGRTSGKGEGLASSPVVNTLPPSEWTRSSSSNEKIVSDMLHDQSWQSADTTAQHLATGPGSLPSTQMTDLQAQIRSTMEAAFWDGIVEGLLQNPPRYERVVTLVSEIKEELQNIVPDKWKQDLQERMDLVILAQVLESGNNDFEYLRQLLDYASTLILKLGAPVRDSDTKAAHQSLLSDLAVAAGSNGEAQRTFAIALVKGLRFIFDQLQILKQDIISARLRSLAPLINGSAGVEYVRKAFAARYNLTLGAPISVEELSSKLPKTSSWIGEVISRLEHEKAELETSTAAFRGSSSDLGGHGDSPAPGLPPIPSMRTGGRVVVGGPSTNSLPAVSSGGEGRSRALVWKSNDTVLRMGVLRIIQRVEPSEEANVPETLGLNVEWLRGCQNEFQRIIVMATGLLVARQGLTGKGIPGTELDDVMQEACGQLDSLLNEPTATISQIGALLAQISSKTSAKDAIQDIGAHGELMTRVLSKSLSADDAVFARVSAAVVSSLRAILLLGKGAEGLGVAKLSLKRIGGSMLIDKVINISDMLDKMSSISCSVHEPWYSSLVTNMS